MITPRGVGTKSVVRAKSASAQLWQAINCASGRVSQPWVCCLALFAEFDVAAGHRVELAQG